MIDLFGMTSAGLDGLARLQVAGKIRHAGGNDLAAFGPSAFARRPAGSFLISSSTQRLAGLNAVLARSDNATKELNRALASTAALAEVLSSLRQVTERALAAEPVSPAPKATPATLIGTSKLTEQALTVTPGLQAATATGTVALKDDVAASQTGTVQLQADAAVDVTGANALAADAVASVTGTVDIASSTNLIADTSISTFETMTIDIGGDVTTLTFGFLPGEVNTAAELEAQLDAITGLEASYSAEGYLVLTAEDGSTSFSVGGTADIQDAFGIVETDYDPTDLLSQGIAEDSTLTFQVNGEAAQTITFGTGTGEVRTLAALNTELATLSGLTASIDGSNRLTFSAGNADDTITVGGTADIAGVFGVTAQTYAPTNLLSQGLSQGQTITLQRSAEAVQIITFGAGAGEVSTLAEFKAELAKVSGLSASIDGSNRLIVAATNAIDTLTVGGTADIAAAFGISEQTYSPQNLLTQGLTQGQTLTFTVGASGEEAIVFGTGDGEVATLSQLETALSQLTGVSGDLDGSNRLTFTASNAAERVEVGGTADIENVFGLAPKAYDPTGSASTGLTQGDTLTVQVGGGALQTITFGTGAGEVNGIGGLKSALAALSGVEAGIDTSGRLAVTALRESDVVTIGGTADIASLFGIATGRHAPLPAAAGDDTGARVRASLAAEYNALVTQIDGIVTDARTGGVNLLAGNEKRIRFGPNAGDVYTINATAFDAADFGLTLVDSEGFDDDSAVLRALAAVDAAQQGVATAARVLEGHKGAVSARFDFSEALAGILDGFVDSATLAGVDTTEAKRLALETRTQLADLIRTELIEADDVFRTANPPRPEDAEKPILPELIGEPDLAKSLFGQPEGSAGELLIHTIAFA